MKKHIFSALFILAAPCAAELTSRGDAAAALKAPAARERLEAIGYLAAAKDYEALAAHFPSEKDAYLRVQIVEALDVAGSTWAYACAEAAAADQNQAVRQAAAGAIAQKTGDLEADKQLIILASDPSEAVRLAAVSAVSQRPGRSSIGIVSAILADKSAPVQLRREAAGALARMNLKEADTELLKYSSDPDKAIKDAASSRAAAKPNPSPQKKTPATKR